jgi:hypothetical protein
MAYSPYMKALPSMHLPSNRAGTIVPVQAIREGTAAKINKPTADIIFL